MNQQGSGRWVTGYKEDFPPREGTSRSQITGNTTGGAARDRNLDTKQLDLLEEKRSDQWTWAQPRAG